MSEKIYAWLLRLYPSRFQEAYREEALQLFRDRARDERGLLSGARLWLDLLGDLAISVPRSYRALPAAIAAHSSAGGPSFLSLEDYRPGFRSLFYGVSAALLVYSVILILIAHGGRPYFLHVSEAKQSSRDSRAMAHDAAGSARGVPRRSAMIAKPTPVVALSFVPFPPTSESTIRITAMVVPVDSGPTPTGQVRFFDEGAVVGIGNLDNGTVTVMGTFSDLPKHFLRAVYAGDENYGVGASPEDVRK